MLIRFNVKNFMSFSEDETGKSKEFSMISSKVQRKSDHLAMNDGLNLLKFATIYGANASGKSNFVKALQFLKSTVIKSLPTGYTEQYCKINSENKEKPSYFEVELSLCDKYYTYGFEVILSQGKFISEWLLELGAEEELIFERNIEEGRYEIGHVFLSEDLTRKLGYYAEDVREDSSVLFLNLMNQNKKNLYSDFPEACVFKTIFEWFLQKLQVRTPNDVIINSTSVFQSTNMEQISNILSAFATGISGIELLEISKADFFSDLYPLNAEKVEQSIEMMEEHLNLFYAIKPNAFVAFRTNSKIVIAALQYGEKTVYQAILFRHNEKNDSFYHFSEESDGTKRLFDLLEILLSNDNQTYVVDEIDRCLHPCLSYKFIELFLEQAKKKNIQLIVTTHESRLLDLELLRRDEI